MSCVRAVLLGVVGQVAALAPVAQIRQVAVFGHVVEVRGRQHDAAACDWMRFTVRGAAVRYAGEPSQRLPERSRTASTICFQFAG
ncbi:hypothetical protein WS55_22730 [Burkholderia pseudomultivorans]|nr:hypothetical protein WS55_22730 [Burkholderia pseudomultivorans]KVC32083.1 hypothetical protein WS56_14335 [Burkholderia pseudomultivorans]